MGNRLFRLIPFGGSKSRQANAPECTREVVSLDIKSLNRKEKRNLFEFMFDNQENVLMDDRKSNVLVWDKFTRQWIGQQEVYGHRRVSITDFYKLIKPV